MFTIKNQSFTCGKRQPFVGFVGVHPQELCHFQQQGVLDIDICFLRPPKKLPTAAYCDRRRSSIGTGTETDDGMRRVHHLRAAGD